MKSADQLRADLIEKIQSIQNVELLSVLERVINDRSDSIVPTLSPEQMEMLKASEEDLAHGRTISHEALNEMDRQWLGTT
jgi:hypothetical protein